MNSNADKAIENFISGCFEKFDEYYKDAVNGKNIFIYGSGVYGKFLYKALAHSGYGQQIKAFINDYITEDELLFDIPVKPLDRLAIDSKNDIIVIGIQNCPGITDALKKRGLTYIQADYDQSFYQDNLMYNYYKCIKVSFISDMVGKIREYHSGCLGNDEDILSLYDEELSKDIISKRLAFYNTGDVSFIDSIPISPCAYFDDGQLNITDKEVYVDCGAFDGDSIKLFYDFTKGRYKKIIGLEPDTISFERLCKAVKGCHDVQLICCATGKENTKMSFSSKGVLGSTFSDEEGSELTDVRRLDDILSGENVTLIKMDIEGAELDTLMGAEQIIKNLRPELAVCIYHRIDDIITIPKLLHSLVPEYRFKVRQHSCSMLETVLYAEV